jgi:hypothetical protein
VKLATLNKSLNKLFQRFLATKYNMSWPKLCCLHTNHSYKHIRKNANYLSKKSWQFFFNEQIFWLICWAGEKQRPLSGSSTRSS